MSSFTPSIIKHKIGLLNLATELGNVSRACRVMGVSRDTFYRYRDAHEQGGVHALLESSRRKPNPKNRVEEAVEAAVVAYALEQPAHGQLRASNELRQRGPGEGMPEMPGLRACCCTRMPGVWPPIPRTRNQKPRHARSRRRACGRP
ncbi:MAG: hypothetical protein RL244_1043, partial [Pseudomonadota bacterium]